MSALAAVYARLNGERLGADPAAVSIDLLRREREYWQLMHDGTTRPEAMGRAVYVSLLTRALPYRVAVEALGDAGVTSTAESAGRVLDDHAIAYPPTDPVAVLEPMAPDRLGEDFYALQTPGHAHDRHQPDPWTMGVPQALADRAPRLLFTLIEVARRWPHVAHRQLFPLLRERPDVALRAGGRALSALAELPELDLSVLDAIDDSHPGTNPDLDEALATLSSLLVERLLKRETDPAKLAPLHLRHAARLAAVDRFDEALPAARSAVALLRRGSTPEPNPQLAEALGTLGRALSGLGEDAEALTSLHAALRIWQRVEERTMRQAVAFAQDNELFSRLQARAGHAEEAHRAAATAFVLWQRLASENAIFAGRLATSYELLGAWSDAVAQWRRIATQAPRLYEPRLALALTRTGSERDLAEAVRIYRRLASADVTYRPHLVRALARLAKQRKDLSLLDEAIRVPLPERFRIDRARVLHLFADISAEIRQRLGDGLGHVLEAITIFREAGRSEDAQSAQNTCTTIIFLRNKRDPAARVRSLLPRSDNPKCPKCRGSGWLTWEHAFGDPETVPCHACHGTGRAGRSQLARFRPCRGCNGRGCPRCGGTGLLRGLRCGECQGFGYSDGDGNVTCVACGGTGIIR